jgi:hypothetical protein
VVVAAAAAEIGTTAAAAAAAAAIGATTGEGKFRVTPATAPRLPLTMKYRLKHTQI